MESPLAPQSHPPTHNKRLRFRAQIRRSSLLDRFTEQRRQLLGQLQYTLLKQLLGKLDNNNYPHQEQLQQLISILDNNCPNAEFNLQVGNEQLEQGFANILLSHAQHLSIIDKTRLLSALNYLTYYHDASSETLSTRQEFIDFLLKQITDLKLEGVAEVEFLQRTVALLMNLSSLVRKEFNLYLAESDICKRIIQQITRSYNISKHMDQSYQEATGWLRALTLRLLKNVLKSLDQLSLVLAVNLVGLVLEDEVYFLEHPHHTFWLLAEGMGIRDFWPELMVKAENRIIQQVVAAADQLQMRCFGHQFLNNKDQTLTDDEYQRYPALLEFLNELFYEDGDDMRNSLTWEIAVENLLNGYMLSEFLLRAHHRRKKEDMVVGLRTYSLLSRSDFVTAKQLIVVRPVEEQYALIKLFLDPSLMSWDQTSAYCLNILQNLIEKDKTFHKVLMEMNVLEPISLALEHQQNTKALMGAIRLAGTLLTCEEGEQRRMPQILDSKGITHRIQKLLDHKSRSVFQKAELFNEQYGTVLEKQQKLK